MKRVVDRFAKQEVAAAIERGAKEAAQQDTDFEALHRQVKQRGSTGMGGGGGRYEMK